MCHSCQPFLYISTSNEHISIEEIYLIKHLLFTCSNYIYIHTYTLSMNKTDSLITKTKSNMIHIMFAHFNHCKLSFPVLISISLLIRCVIDYRE